MLRKPLHFLYSLSCNWIGTLGVVLTTGSVVTFIALEIPRQLGVLTNAALGLVTYLLLPTLFIVGLLLILWGWRRFRKVSGLPMLELLAERFGSDAVEARPQGARLLITAAILSLLSVAFLGMAGMRTLQFMDEPHFCGTACHSVMNPEWVTYQQSPHAHVKCVECHVGEGVGPLLDSKINGAYQVLSLAFDLYDRPIPTPVHQLRPARETCEKCHWPSKFYGRSLKTLVRYQSDRASTPLYTTLSLKVDSEPGAGDGGIHWHVASANEVRYASVADQRQRMMWVEARRPDGTYERFENRRLSDAVARSGDVRVMDCVDCHNRATHIYQDPAKAVDAKLESGQLDHRLPYIRREAVRALTRGYASAASAREGITHHLEQFYHDQGPGVTAAQVDTAAQVLQRIYARNIHHGMNITWGSYPSFLGHDRGGGCFRCHNSYMVNKAGKAIGQDCTLCHSMLAYESPTPFQFLSPVSQAAPEGAMHQFLKTEFTKSFR